MVSGRRYSGPLPKFSPPPSPSTLRRREPPQTHTTFGHIRLRNRTLVIAGIFFFIILFIWMRRRAPSQETGLDAKIDWSKYVYSLYATDSATLCNAVMVFEALDRLGSKAERNLFYPRHMDTVISDTKDRDSQLLVLARRKYRVNLSPIKLMNVFGHRTPDKPKLTWDKSVTKFFSFTLTHFERVIHLDTDITLLKNIDELFLAPSSFAMPRAYWSETQPPPLTSLLVLLKPSMLEFNALKEKVEAGADSETVQSQKYDMELLNDRYGSRALVLPQRPYALLSGEFRSHNHTAYLGDTSEEWDAQKIYDEAKLVHFSDWPLPKPWIMWPTEGLAEMQPDCGGSREGTCTERTIWKGLYDDFRERRKDVCRLLSVPAPDWEQLKGKGKGKDGEKKDGEEKNGDKKDENNNLGG